VSAFNPRIHHRRSVRLADRDYRRGTYFVTICTQDRSCLLGDVVSGVMHLNDAGAVVVECLQAITGYQHVTLDAFVVMPNHVHALLILGEWLGDRLSGDPSTRTLGQLVGAFKSSSTRRLQETGVAMELPVRQRSYHERAVRQGADLTRIRLYIAENPLNWAADAENPAFPAAGQQGQASR